MVAIAVVLSARPRGAQNQTPPTASSGTPAGNPSSQAPPTSSSEISAQPPTALAHGNHTVTVTFDYDFRVTPACSKKVTKNCVGQFIAYDISAGVSQPTMLFPIPVPANPAGLVHGITATSPTLNFESGKHLISVSAMSPNGTHSKRSLCTTWITIP